MQLSVLTTAQIRSATEFGINGTPYLDGTLLENTPDGLHEIRGVYPADVTNAVQYDDPKAWNLLNSNGFIFVLPGNC